MGSSSLAKRLKITQVRSSNDSVRKQKRTLQALGLRRMHQTVVHRDTPQIRGMILKIRHLLEVEEE
ncbi:MAG: 50S ribosomal protein L30 [candidate division Zixibacteria bacterium DG_27]|nr:MAG: 50S ribosomal protein L30 [candidate division Zixibacteria bacterium DG_27]